MTDNRDPIVPVRYTPDEVALIEAVMDHLGTTSKAETLRVVLKAYCKANKIGPLKPKPVTLEEVPPEQMEKFKADFRREYEAERARNFLDAPPELQEVVDRLGGRKRK